jgi:multiple sugar transport system permease protein
VSLASSSIARRLPRYRLRRVLVEAGSVMLGIILLIWSLAPVYNMFLIALDPEEGEVEFSGNIWPPEVSLDSFRVVLMQDDRYLEHFWRQFGNSLYIGLVTMFLTVLVGSMASFAVGRMRLGKGELLAKAGLLTYAIPASFLVFPFYRMMHAYGLSNNFWGVIAAQVTFAAPFSILVLLQYGRLIPIELDDSARVDGASAVQVYSLIYLPLMVPALALVAIYALLLAWNDYLYQFVLLSSVRNMTVAMTQGHLFEDTDAPWNAMMAAGILYALPPLAIFFALRRCITVSRVRGGGID